MKAYSFPTGQKAPGGALSLRAQPAERIGSLRLHCRAIDQPAEQIEIAGDTNSASSPQLSVGTSVRHLSRRKMHDDTLKRRSGNARQMSEQTQQHCLIPTTCRSTRGGTDAKRADQERRQSGRQWTRAHTLQLTALCRRAPLASTGRISAHPLPCRSAGFPCLR